MSVCSAVITQTAITCIAVKSMLGSFTKICQQINFGLKSNNNRHYMKTYMNISAHFWHIPYLSETEKTSFKQKIHKQNDTHT